MMSFLVFGALVIWNYSPIEPTTPLTLEKLTIGVEKSILPATVFIAENKGYFREEGLDISIKMFNSGKDSFLDMLENRGVDIATVAPTPIMFNSFKRKDFSIVATFVDSDDDVKLIARNDKGIETAGDLIGKKIGTPSGTTGQFFTDIFLLMRGIEKDEVEVINISPQELPLALKNNLVDAIVIWEPHAYHAQNLLNGKAKRIPSSDIYHETFNFMAMNDFTTNHPQLISKFLRAVIKASQYTRQHKKEAQLIVANRLNMEINIIEKLWDDYAFEVSINQELLLTLELEARWAIEQNLTGGVTTVPNYLDYIYTDSLQKINPEAIGIFH